MPRITLLLLSLLFVGCATNPMVVAENQTVEAPPPDKSQIVFLRSSLVGHAYNGSLFDVTDGKTEFIGIIANGTKVSHLVQPGRRTFMVVSEAADFMEAELEAGKTYYSIVTPRMGAWAVRFSLWPIKRDASADFHQNMPEFEQWLDSTALVRNSEMSLDWAETSKDSIEAKKNKYWPVWKQKSPEDLARRTLSPEDGIFSRPKEINQAASRTLSNE